MLFSFHLDVDLPKRRTIFLRKIIYKKKNNIKKI